MKTLLLTKDGQVYKVVSECDLTTGLYYICELGEWSSEYGDYLFDKGLVETYYIQEDDVECIDTNTAVIVNAKSHMMGFDLDYINDELYY